MFTLIMYIIPPAAVRKRKARESRRREVSGTYLNVRERQRSDEFNQYGILNIQLILILKK